MIILGLCLLSSIVSQFVDPSEYSQCKKIEVRSNMHKVNDMVKNGITVPEWTDSTPVPVIIGADKQIDYIYFVLTQDTNQYNINNFELLQDDKQYAQSKLEIDPSHKDNKYAIGHQEHLYAIKIIYHCSP